MSYIVNVWYKKKVSYLNVSYLFHTQLHFIIELWVLFECVVCYAECLLKTYTYSYIYVHDVGQCIENLRAKAYYAEAPRLISIQ